VAETRAASGVRALRYDVVLSAVTRTRGDLEGYQAAALNAVEGSLHGFQTAHANILSGNLRGAQISGVFGIAGGHVRGAQGAGIFNIAGDGLEGWQGAGIFNISGDSVKGGQLAGIFNVAADSVRGIQGAGVFNVAGSIEGIQGAGVFNAALGGVRGVQGAAVLNIGGMVRGYQIGLVNLSNDYESGFPIGLVNISRKGSFHGQSWIDETGTTYAGLRTGVRSVYSILAVGTRPFADRTLIAPTLGTGIHLDISGTPLFVEPDLLYSSLFEPVSDVTTDWARLRVALGWKASSIVSVFGGVSYNVATHMKTDAPLTGTNIPWFRSINNDVSLWPGAFAGIRIGR
jgi:hypothetical protein